MTDSETLPPLAGQLTIYDYEVVIAVDPQGSDPSDPPQDPEASELSDPGAEREFQARLRAMMHRNADVLAKLAESDGAEQSRPYDAPYDPRVANPDPELDDRAGWPVERSEEAKAAYVAGFEAGGAALVRVLDNARAALDGQARLLREALDRPEDV